MYCYFAVSLMIDKKNFTYQRLQKGDEGLTRCNTKHLTRSKFRILPLQIATLLWSAFYFHPMWNSSFVVPLCHCEYRIRRIHCKEHIWRRLFSNRTRFFVIRYVGGKSHQQTCDSHIDTNDIFLKDRYILNSLGNVNGFIDVVVVVILSDEVVTKYQSRKWDSRSRNTPYVGKSNVVPGISSRVSSSTAAKPPPRK